MSLFIVGLDNTIVNLALPSIQRELGAPISDLQWTIDAYAVVLAALLLLSGALADRFGRRRVFQIGLVVFALGSLLCGLATSAGALIAFRALQAVGGSMLNPVAMSIITNTFTEPRERASAIGVWGSVVGLSMALGPVVGGALVDATGWRSIFWINVPIGILAVVLTALIVPESRADKPRRLDPVGQVLVLILLTTLTFGIIEGPRVGWVHPVIIGCFVVAVAATILFFLHEKRCDEPLLHPSFFRSVPFSGAVVTAICGVAALSGFLFINTLYLQNVRDFSPFYAGLLTLPMAVMVAAFSPLSGRLIGTYGSRIPLLIAGGGITGCAAMLSFITTSTPLWYLIVAYLLFGIGFGSINAPITNNAVGGMPRSQAGVAAAVASTSRQVGATMGVAVVGSLITANAGLDFTSASRAGWYVILGCGLLVLMFAWTTTTERARATVRLVQV